LLYPSNNERRKAKMSNFAIDAQHLINNFTNACVNKAKTSIRIQTGYSTRGISTTTSWDYFELDENGVIKTCPRGLTKQYKGVKVLGLEKLPPMTSQLTGETI
jgi:hypothetical protein